MDDDTKELYKRIEELQSWQTATNQRLAALEAGHLAALDRQAQENRDEIKKLKRSIKAGLTQLLAQLFGGENDE